MAAKRKRRRRTRAGRPRRASRGRRPSRRARRPRPRPETLSQGARFTIRPIATSEEAEVLKIIASHDETDSRYAKRYYDEYFFSKTREKDRVFVALTPRRRVAGVSGYFVDTREPKGVFWLAWTYVLPAYRRFGVGRELVRRVEAELRRKRGRKLYLHTSSHSVYKGAIRFYLDHGFKWEGYLRDYYRKGEDQIILGKTLSR